MFLYLFVFSEGNVFIFVFSEGNVFIFVTYFLIMIILFGRSELVTSSEK